LNSRITVRTTRRAGKYRRPPASSTPSWSRDAGTTWSSALTKAISRPSPPRSAVT